MRSQFAHQVVNACLRGRLHNLDDANIDPPYCSSISLHFRSRPSIGLFFCSPSTARLPSWCSSAKLVHGPDGTPFPITAVLCLEQHRHSSGSMRTCGPRVGHRLPHADGAEHRRGGERDGETRCGDGRGGPVSTTACVQRLLVLIHLLQSTRSSSSIRWRSASTVSSCCGSPRSSRWRIARLGTSRRERSAEPRSSA